MLARVQQGMLLLLLVPYAAAQFGAGPSTTDNPHQTTMGDVDAQFWAMDYLTAQARKQREQEERPSEGVSKLDLKAPAKSRREYEKGVRLLLQNNLEEAVEHLSKAIAVYPNFVAAHTSLGTAYMNLHQPDKARDQYQRAVLLDDHLPNSFSNLCSAELALKDYPAAEQAIKKASSISPLDMEFLTTLTYTQVLSHDYHDAIATAHQVHEGKHDGAAMVHYFAAAAWREQKNLLEMQRELETFLTEDPKNPNAEKARKLIAEIKEIQSRPKTVQHIVEPAQPTAAELEERKQVAEAEAMCLGCSSKITAAEPDTAVNDLNFRQGEDRVVRTSAGWLLRKDVDEVALFFAAIDNGKPVSNLRPQDVSLLDDRQPPATITNFRGESELPLRLGLVIDTSESITGRFSFEQDAATRFLQNVVTNSDDLAFVIGFSNSVLLVQDFTADQNQISHAIEQLVPSGGTALWDALGFAAHKLGSRPEPQPVARILVVISDGEDNSSQSTLKLAIEAAERENVIVYTVSTSESKLASGDPSTGDRALGVLAEQSGGAAFVPGAARNLKRSLAELQQVIRSRYLISYKPARFQPDGHFRKIDITAQKSGHKLRVYARKGYYAQLNSPAESNF
ncbi:MAG TPA: VWA domain-containing protein [Terriglobales bacterium]|nr:VWA domain-containing protein [Terriglobales bacterium]